MTDGTADHAHLDWRMSSHTTSSECVEVAVAPAVIHIRDSKHRDRPSLRLTPAQWGSLHQGLKNGPGPAGDRGPGRPERSVFSGDAGSGGVCDVDAWAVAGAVAAASAGGRGEAAGVRDLV
ncbi:DUF397 domain-containing protein [Actinocorallia longicatena]|uniref:DUF397 domain-containing protein n=1 Tax=Actinocorallia longicatena TaxID=111803 RepID=A0ABP6QIA4_9ACTN